VGGDGRWRPKIGGGGDGERIGARGGEVCEERNGSVWLEGERARGHKRVEGK
jgi:hypothetical protein